VLLVRKESTKGENGKESSCIPRSRRYERKGRRWRWHVKKKRKQMKPGGITHSEETHKRCRRGESEVTDSAMERDWEGKDLVWRLKKERAAVSMGKTFNMGRLQGGGEQKRGTTRVTATSGEKCELGAVFSQMFATKLIDKLPRLRQYLDNILYGNVGNVGGGERMGLQ